MHWRSLRKSALLAIAGTAIALPGQTPVPASWVEARIDRLETFYRDLHENPELSFQEKRTADRLATELRTAGLEVTTGVGGHGVVGGADDATEVDRELDDLLHLWAALHLVRVEQFVG